MFEFHGWATIRAGDRDDPAADVIRAREDEAINGVRAAIRDADDGFSSFDLRRTGNDLIVLSVHGLRNHRYEPVIGLFRRIAAELPDAYGLLYVRDDEDRRRGADYENVFRVWRLARGRFEERDDPFLSPCIPTIEPPWESPDAR